MATESNTDNTAVWAVRCRGLTKAFGAGEAQTMALRGTDFAVAAGQLTLLVGPSGCGKTTLISVVAGILLPTTGTVEVLGERVDLMAGTHLVRFRGHNVGFVFQQANLLPALSAEENAAVPLILLGHRRRPAVEQAARLLAVVGLEGRRRALPSELSGGELQRVAIVRALVHQPRLVVCDEPTASLDTRSGRTVMELIRRQAVTADRAVVVVTHDPRIFEFADRIAYMEDGRITHSERVTPGAPNTIQ